MNRALVGRLGPLLGLCLLLPLFGVSRWGLWERDEGRYADVARQMLESGDFVTPRIDGTVFLDKPPLVYWVTAASLLAWGHNEAGARFGQILFALLTLLAVRGIGRLLFDRRRANIAVIVLASSVGFFTSSHILGLDLALTFFVTLTLLCFLRGYRAERAGVRWYLGMFAAAAGGLLTKGAIGVALPAMTIACFLFLRRDWRRLGEVPWTRGILTFLAIAAPWYVAVSLANPQFPRYFFIHEHVDRFVTSVHHRQGGWYYYLAVASLGLLPWSLVLPTHLLPPRGRIREVLSRLRSEAPAFIVSWLVPGLAFFTISQSKLPLYILPLFPAAALGIAAVLERDLSQSGASGRLFLRLSVLLLGLAGGAAILWHRHNEWRLRVRTGVGAPLILAVVALTAAALMFGFLLARRGRHLTSLAVAAAFWMGACYLVLAVIGRVNFFNETKHFAAVLRHERQNGEPVFAYRCYLRGLPFYLRGTIGLVSPHSDDLRLGREYGHEAGTFPDEATFLAHLRGDSRVFVVIRHQDLLALQRKAERPLYVLARSEIHDLVSNRLGVTEARELSSAFPAGFDFEDVARRVAGLMPGGAVEMFEIERLAGGLYLAVEVYRGGSHYEVRFPIVPAGQVTVVRENPAFEESGEEHHLLRVVPFPDSGVRLPVLPPPA